MILQERLMAEPKIEVFWNTEVTAIRADDRGVRAASLKSTRNAHIAELPADGVFIFIGFDPNNRLVPAGVKLNADGYVITDEKCQTQIPGIFVIGDLSEKYARQIVLSAADGCLAALAATHYVENRRAEL
jgi:thioredoxin reductase (NADPH)